CYLLGRARILAVVGDKGQPAPVRGEGQPTVEPVMKDAAVWPVWPGQRHGGAAVGRDQPDVGGGVGLWWHQRRLLPTSRPWPSRAEGDPAAVRRKHGAAGVRLPRLHRLALVRVAVNQPQGETFLLTGRVDPLADVCGAFAIGRED